MSVDTIDLSGIEPDVCEAMLDLEFVYDHDRLLKSRQIALYRQEKLTSDKMFSEWLLETNAQLIQDVDKFIKNCLGLNQHSILFPQAYTNGIFPATVILGMQASDHEPTLDTIEDHIRMPHKERVMMMFCMSGTWTPLSQLIPATVKGKLKMNTNIIKEPNDFFKIIRKRLIENQGTQYKMGPELIDLIDKEILYRDASITNLKYLYQYALFEHQLKNYSTLAALPKKELISLLKSQPDLANKLVSLQTMSPKVRNINWREPVTLAEYCQKNIKTVSRLHSFLNIQLTYYFELLRDETETNFPDSLNDFYREFISKSKHRDLGHSSRFADALCQIKNYSAEGLKRRITKILKNHYPLPPGVKDHDDVYRICANFEEKLENNDGCKEVVNEFIQHLFKHAQLLENPFNLCLQEAIYNHNHEVTMLRTLPTTRYNMLQELRDTSMFFGKLYEEIHHGDEEFNLSFLYEDFKQKIEEMQPKENVSSDNQKKSRRASVKSRKTSQNDKGRKSKLACPHDSFKSIHDNDELMKAFFFDLIDCMRHQGLITIDTRQSKKGTVKKCTWL